MQSVALNLISSLIFFLLGLFVSRVLKWWIWKNRLAKIERAARENEIAICVRVGGNSEPEDDVKKFLREKQPAIKTLLIYNVASGDLDDAKTAQSIIEDVLEGLRAYGKGEITRIHYFPVGIVAYAAILPAIVSNWGAIVVYHRRSDGYVPLYQIDKEVRHQDKRAFKPVRAWDVITLVNDSAVDSLHAKREVAQIIGSTSARAGEREEL